MLLFFVSSFLLGATAVLGCFCGQMSEYVCNYHPQMQFIERNKQSYIKNSESESETVRK